MKERRGARVGTVSGLALLAGGTAVAASVGGDVHSGFATLLLGTLTLGLGHALVDEIKRQARRGSTSGWARADTTNAVLLGIWAEMALLASILVFDTVPTRSVALALAVAYAACCGYFVTERRRSLADRTEAATANRQAMGSSEIDADVPLTTSAMPAAPAVLQRRHPGLAGHAPTAGHGPMTHSHSPARNATTPGHSHPTTTHGPATHSNGPAAYAPAAHAPAAHTLSTAGDPVA